MSDVVLEFREVWKRFGATTIVDHVSFTVDRGEFFTLLGPSGCGKTTTLRLIAGLEVPDGGEIVLGGQTLAAPAAGICLPPDRRNLGMMFQSYAIWPHLSVFENVAFPLRVRRVPAAEVARRVAEALELVGLEGMEDRGATQLSGGQQQRVALARAVVYTPSLLLLDEPLSNLDVKLREQMRVELRALQQRLNLTVIYVTHDQSEAMSLSDRIAVVNKGRFEQIGTPRDVYERPRKRFVGDFLGRTIIIRGIVRGMAEERWVELPGAERITVPPETDASVTDGTRVRVLCRPEEVALLPPGDCVVDQVTGRIENVAYMGDHLEYTIRAAELELLLTASKKMPHAVGAEVRLQFDPQAVTILP
jgi:ABC-type Fe3+/spermidine/putrescine transport system ATPase subunit